MNSPYKLGHPTKYNPTTGAGTKPPAKPGEYRIRQAGMLSSRAYGLLEAAKTRVELNWRAIPAEFKEELGLSGSNGGRIDLSEYLLWLQMKQKRGDLADFLRGLTPGLFELLRIASEEKAGISLSVYCDKGRFCRDRMTADETGRELLGMMEWGGKSIDRAFLISGHYATVLGNKCANEDWWQTLSALRDTEEKARNLAAHTMTRVDEGWLKEEGLPSGREIMQLVKNSEHLLHGRHTKTDLKSPHKRLFRSAFFFQ